MGMWRSRAMVIHRDIDVEYTVEGTPYKLCQNKQKNDIALKSQYMKAPEEAYL